MSPDSTDEIENKLLTAQKLIKEALGVASEDLETLDDSLSVFKFIKEDEKDGESQLIPLLDNNVDQLKRFLKAEQKLSRKLQKRIIELEFLNEAHQQSWKINDNKIDNVIALLNKEFKLLRKSLPDQAFIDEKEIDEESYYIAKEPITTSIEDKIQTEHEITLRKIREKNEQVETQYLELQSQFQHLKLKYNTQEQENKLKDQKIAALTKILKESEEDSNFDFEISELKEKIKLQEEDLGGKDQILINTRFEYETMERKYFIQIQKNENYKKELTDLKIKLGEKNNEIKVLKQSIEYMPQLKTQIEENKRIIDDLNKNLKDLHHGENKDELKLSQEIDRTMSIFRRLERQANIFSTDFASKTLLKDLKRHCDVYALLLGNVFNSYSHARILDALMLKNRQEKTMLARAAGVEQILILRVLRELEDSGLITYNEEDGMVELKN
ncbi:MAG: hypothetical protein ACXAC7_05460 [Candidatus Hodarchaeales archaeon]|jgi:hypothetical protein